jgi:hypothetical protein
MELEKFAEICRALNLNIQPIHSWQWDASFGTALVVFEKKNRELICLPLSQEFERCWDVSTLEQAPAAFFDYFRKRFGVVPGQEIYTAHEDRGPILFAVLWPWGDDCHISLRVGVFFPDHLLVDAGQVQDLLHQWLSI